MGSGARGAVLDDDDDFGGSIDESTGIRVSYGAVHAGVSFRLRWPARYDARYKGWAGSGQLSGGVYLERKRVRGGAVIWS